jgi:hypothetical protein
MPSITPPSPLKLSAILSPSEYHDDVILLHKLIGSVLADGNDICKGHSLSHACASLSVSLLDFTSSSATWFVNTKSHHSLLFVLMAV